MLRAVQHVRFGGGFALGLAGLPDGSGQRVPGITGGDGANVIPDEVGSEGWRMTGAGVDFAEVFRQLPIPVLLVTPALVIADANAAYLEVTRRSREELVGRDAFEAFPDNPNDPGSSGVADMRASMRRVLATGDSETTAFQRYDVQVLGKPGEFERRYWCPVNKAVFGADGRVALIAQCVEEISEKVQRFVEGLSAGGPE